ncbi:MAG: Flp pilus assembly complex ATPase component TadA [Spirochaetes bacterium]|nr:Flp pilus assembly complex ATPase component TadA [Spirochaetota bacterium]
MISVDIDRHGRIEVAEKTTLLELKTLVGVFEEPLVPVVGALYNNRLMGLEYPLTRNCSVRFLSTRHEEGLNIYSKSLSILLHAAFIDRGPKNALLKVEHSLNKGFFFSYIDGKPLACETVRRLEERMREIVEKNLPFEKYEYEVEDALDLLEEIGAWDRYYLLKYSDRSKTTVYRLGECVNLAQGPVVPSAGYLKVFGLRYYPPGLVLLFPETTDPTRLPEAAEQKKLFQIYSEQREWSRILDVDSAGKLNRLIIERKIDNLVWVTEGLHEKKIAQIADIITKNASKRRIILLAGPTSSGKTTFAKRLTVQLLANGIAPEVISLDNYYLPRERMPKTEAGTTDLESLNSLDIDLINAHLNALLDGKAVTVPKYEFKTGSRQQEGRNVRLLENQVVIIEGIHALNEKLTPYINREQKYKIYVSVLTQLNIDVINRIPTSTVRLLRRIVRDSQFRGYSARETIGLWPEVRRAEDRNIFPFGEEADIMFNSSLVYEMSVLKGYAQPLLKDIDEDDELYSVAKRLLHFLDNFLYITSEKVPRTSILREFIGESGFSY